MKRISFVLVIVLLFVFFGSVLAQSSASFNLPCSLIDNGGGSSNSASFVVTGSMGAPVGNGSDATSASFVVSSGYWPDNCSSRALYLPLLLK